MKRLIYLPLGMLKKVSHGHLFRGSIYPLSHLKNLDEFVIGPIQRDEALLLFALVRVVDPKTLVEFGFYQGHSAINFLKAMSPDARLYSFDISSDSMKAARRINDTRFNFLFKSQSEFEPSDVDNRTVDLVFFDAAHDFQLNLTTLERLMDSLSERALIVVHDTGIWHGDLKRLKTPEGYFLNSGYIHQPDERMFVNHIKANMNGFEMIHLHCTSKFRHGLTVIQRNIGPLPL